jgi:ribosome biogenesis GTPase
LSSIDLPSIGWDEYFSHAFTSYAETHRPGRVACVDRGAVGVLTHDGPCRALVASSYDATVGDWVALTDYELGPSRVDAVLPRRTAIVRGAVTGHSTGQILAANVDTVFAALPLTTEPKLGLVERLVTLGWDSGATPVVVLTKADAASAPDDVIATATASAPGVDVYPVSVRTGEGLDQLAPYVAHGRTVALIGQSGVGKSTLINSLVGAEVLATRDIRADGKGRHTTVRRELVTLATGGVLIDTPGLRGVALCDAEAGLEQTFADVEALTGNCYFADCAHGNEPGCAVIAALSDGSLPLRRYESWQKLKREARWMASRTDARLRAEERRRWKIRAKQARQRAQPRA